MIKNIVRDPIFLSRKAADATPEDVTVACDLLDTLEANSEGCVGLAANMIGVAKRIIVFENGGRREVMFNPEIIRREGEFEAEEGCLSLDGTRKTTRFGKIKVRYRTEDFSVRVKSYSGFTAQIIQHELDHLSGILI